MGSAPSSLVGRRVGRYDVLEHVATGRLAEVLVARIVAGERDGRRVALKRILPRFAKDPEVRSAVTAGVVATSAQTADGGVHVEGVFEEDGELLVEMELLEGATLASVLDRLRAKDEVLGIADVVAILATLATTLTRLHAATGADGSPLVHGGLGPPAVFVTEAGETKLLELGVERALAVLDPDTRSGLIGPRAQYLSPEQIGFRLIDGKADVWSLGVTAWELLTGRSLFGAETLLETLDRVRGAPVPRASSVRADVPASLDRLIAEMLAREAFDRPSMAHVAARLRDEVSPEVGAAKADLRATMVRLGLAASAPRGLPTPSAGTRPPAVRAPTPSAGLAIGGRTLGDAGPRSETFVVGAPPHGGSIARIARDLLAIALGAAAGWLIVELVLRWTRG